MNPSTQHINHQGWLEVSLKITCLESVITGDQRVAGHRPCGEPCLFFSHVRGPSVENMLRAMVSEKTDNARVGQNLISGSWREKGIGNNKRTRNYVMPPSIKGQNIHTPPGLSLP